MQWSFLTCTLDEVLKTKMFLALLFDFVDQFIESKFNRMRQVDHIVYCVPILEEGIDYIENILGVRPAIGGRHLNRGTKNALLNLGNACYLEILAADYENEDFKGERWMGIDLIDHPKITRWSIKSEDLKSDSRILQSYNPELSTIFGGSRKTTSGSTLSWNMMLPSSRPELELVPFMTDWSTSSVHPTDSLPEICTISSVFLSHPDPLGIQPVLDQLNIEIQVAKADEAKICVEINSPNGLKTLC